MLADLHIHTKYSEDCFSEPLKILKFSEKRGLTAIAITDHNTLKGSLITSKIKRANIIVIKGMEIKTNIGDIIGLFIEEEIKSRNYLEVIDEIKEQDGLVYFPHPFKAHKKILSKNIDVVEIFNSRIKPEENMKAKNFAEKNRKAIGAGSDAHTYWEIGLAGIKIKDVDDIESIRKAIVKKKVEIFGHYSPIYLKKISKLIKILKHLKYLSENYVC